MNIKNDKFRPSLRTGMTYNQKSENNKTIRKQKLTSGLLRWRLQ